MQIDNDPQELVREVRKTGRGAPVAAEATYGWIWAVEALQAARCEVHLYGMKAMRKRKRRGRCRVPSRQRAVLVLRYVYDLDEAAITRELEAALAAAVPDAYRLTDSSPCTAERRRCGRPGRRRR